MLGPGASQAHTGPHRAAVSVTWYGGSRASIMGLGSQESHWMHQWRGHGSLLMKRWVGDWWDHAKTFRGAVGGYGCVWGGVGMQVELRKEGDWGRHMLMLMKEAWITGMHRADASS